MEFLLFATASMVRVRWLPGALTPGVKRPGHEANYLPPCRAEVKMHEAIPSLHQYVFMAWYLFKQRDIFQSVQNAGTGNKEPIWPRDLRTPKHLCCGFKSHAGRGYKEFL